MFKTITLVLIQGFLVMELVRAEGPGILYESNEEYANTLAPKVIVTTQSFKEKIYSLLINNFLDTGDPMGNHAKTITFDSELSFQEIETIRKNLLKFLNPTRLLFSPKLSELLGKKIWLKLETEQPTGSFKVRGVLAKVLTVISKRNKQEISGITFITGSTGNKGRALAYITSLIGAKAIVYIPLNAPDFKEREIRRLGAEVFRFGTSYNEAIRKAKEAAAKKGYIDVSGSEDNAIILGNATLALEVKDQMNSFGKSFDTIICPVGGGGMIAGMSIALKKDNKTVVGVQAKKAAAMKRSLEKGKIVELKEVNTIADGTAIRRPGDTPFRILKNIGSPPIVEVSEEDIKRAINLLWTTEEVKVEGAGALSLAALLSEKNSGIFKNSKNIVLILSGENIDEKLHQEFVREGKAGKMDIIKDFHYMMPDFIGHAI